VYAFFLLVFLFVSCSRKLVGPIMWRDYRSGSRRVCQTCSYAHELVPVLFSKYVFNEFQIVPRHCRYILRGCKLPQYLFIMCPVYVCFYCVSFSNIDVYKEYAVVLLGVTDSDRCACLFVSIATDEDSRHSHLLFTLSVYQYRVEQTATTQGYNNGLSTTSLSHFRYILVQ